MQYSQIEHLVITKLKHSFRAKLVKIVDKILYFDDGLKYSFSYSNDKNIVYIDKNIDNIHFHIIVMPKETLRPSNLPFFNHFYLITHQDLTNLIRSHKTEFNPFFWLNGYYIFKMDNLKGFLHEF